MIIGTQGNQPFSIPDSKVSRYHAVLERDQNGQYFIKDTNSTNGTFIYNGTNFVRLYPNQLYPVSPDTMIQLGPDTRFHVRKLIPSHAQTPRGPQAPNPEPKKQQPKRVDISHLRYISENYDEQKLKLESKVGMINGLRGLTILISMLGAGAGAMFGGEDKVTSSIISIGIAVVLIAILLTFINSYNKKLMRMKKDNEQTYAVKYVCPECHVSFRGKIYENILAERSCPRCKTKYYDKNIQPQGA